MDAMDGAATARAVLADGMGGSSCGVARVRPWSREFCSFSWKDWKGS